MKLADLVPLLAGHRILVVGDLVLDEYLTGRPSRISREAPVLVLDEVERECRAGSAGSPAANVVALGSQATIVGVVGVDAAGERLRSNLSECGIDCSGLVRISGAATATKTRVLAQGYTGGLYGRQQVLRVDRVPPLPPEAAAECAAQVAQLGAQHDAVLISDYRGGVVTDATVGAARSTGRPIAVDSQGELRRFRGVDLVKINQAEAQAAVGSTDVLGLAGGLRRELEVRCLVVTLGAEGIAVFTEEACELVPACRATEVFDVTGAGDTVIAVFALGLVAGVPLRSAAQLANAAASIVVRRLGVASVSPQELTVELQDAHSA
jgi:rfaE bifunctional protein kinase chain/domain